MSDDSKTDLTFDLNLKVITGLKAGDMLLIRVPKEVSKSGYPQAIRYLEQRLEELDLKGKVVITLAQEGYDLERIPARIAREFLKRLIAASEDKNEDSEHHTEQLP